MERQSRSIATVWLFLAGWLIFTLIGASSRAQSPPGAAPGGGSGAVKAGAKVKVKAGEPKTDAPAAKVEAPRREPSPEFREEIRKTVEQRRRRRARRGQAAEARPPGAIVPWPMPPALIIRQTPEVHDEIESLLGQLRRGG